jgi:hypothetical protein
LFVILEGFRHVVAQCADTASDTAELGYPFANAWSFGSVAFAAAAVVLLLLLRFSVNCTQIEGQASSQRDKRDFVQEGCFP